MSALLLFTAVLCAPVFRTSLKHPFFLSSAEWLNYKIFLSKKAAAGHTNSAKLAKAFSLLLFHN